MTSFKQYISPAVGQPRQRHRAIWAPPTWACPTPIAALGASAPPGSTYTLTSSTQVSSLLRVQSPPFIFEQLFFWETRLAHLTHLFLQTTMRTSCRWLRRPGTMLPRSELLLRLSLLLPNQKERRAKTRWASYKLSWCNQHEIFCCWTEAKLTNEWSVDCSLLSSPLPQENIILAYDTADDGDDATLDFSNSEQSDDVLTSDDDYPDNVQIDWASWISNMPSPVLID